MEHRSVRLRNLLSFSLCVLFIAIFATTCFASQASTSNANAARLFQLPSMRQSFTNAADFEQTITLLQEYGQVETAKTFLLKLPEGTQASDIIFTQETSNQNVLSEPDNSNLLVSVSNGVLNITSTFSFDEMVGKCDYTLTATRKSTKTSIGSITLRFVIVGMTFYIEKPEGGVSIVSGSGRDLAFSYTDLFITQTLENRKIRVLIQYPDGSSSKESAGSSIRSGESLNTAPVDSNGLFQHESSRCSLTMVGTVKADGIPEFPSGCGFGFYRDEEGNLCFGVDILPYRVGRVNFLFSWKGLTNGNPLLSEEIWEDSFTLAITGTPPVVVMRRTPDHGLLRPEGGEVIILHVINSELYNIRSYRIEVSGVEKFFRLIPGTMVESELIPSAKRISFLSEPGFGTDLNWTLVYETAGPFDVEFALDFHEAIYFPGSSHFFSYDEIPLTIKDMNPSMGNVEGGTEITIEGHFPFFDAKTNGLYFSGIRLDSKYIKMVTENTIVCLSPPKRQLGESYEYRVTIRMGKGISNASLFYFLVKDAVVRISQAGTSELPGNAFQIGRCTNAIFTAVVVPLTNQIRSYKWSLHANADDETNLLSTPAFGSSNADAQTLQLDPETMEVGGYTLKIRVSLLGTVLEQEIVLMRDEIVTIGAFILRPPTRTTAYPETPARISAVVSPPTCYNGSQIMVFEWKAFNDTQVFSSANARSLPHDGLNGTSPARLGWEYVIPRETLRPGTHSVSLKVWMQEDENVVGQAESELVIHESPVIAVIRHGEEHLTTNHASSLNLFGSSSYDPDVLDEEKYLGLTFEWSCLQAEENNFSNGVAQACIAALLPDSSLETFTVQMNVVQSLKEIRFMQYTLTVRKGTSRVSAETKLVVEIRDDGNSPHLTDYEIRLSNADGEPLRFNSVPYYEQSILEVYAGPDVTWSYSLIEPTVPDFFSSGNLISSPLFYSPEADIYSVTGNQKPLGIEAASLRPLTTYKFRIRFDRTENHQATEVIISVRTTEALILGFPTPALTEGTPETTFTATAGVPMVRSAFSYYFVLIDSEGYEFCLGGCTGYDVIHFKIGRPGVFTITAYVYDTEGKALLDSLTLEKKITVTERVQSVDFFSELETLFDNGNDNGWTQLAHELTISLPTLEKRVVLRQINVDRVNRATALEDLRESQTEFVSYISDGARKIVCSAYPNSYHGKDFISFMFDLSVLPSVDSESFYNILQGLHCCIANTPHGTINMMQDFFPRLMNTLNGHAINFYQGGTSRQRLRTEETSVANEYADLHLWISSNMFKSISSGKVVGFTSTEQIGREGQEGNVSVVVASSAGHLPTRLEDGKVLSVVRGSSEIEEFIPRDECLVNLFPTREGRKLYFVLHEMPNFIEIGGFQDAPVGSNLADKLYLVKIFETESDGDSRELRPQEENFCFCWRLPVRELQQELEGSLDFMPGIYAATKFKKFEENATDDGTLFTYEYSSSKTREYDTQSGWVEGCRQGVGAIVSSTKVTKSVENALAGSGRISGIGVSGFWVIVVGALLFAVAAMATSWIIAVRAMANGDAPLASVAPNELYVERDVYGRATIYDANAIQEGSK